MKHTRLTRLMNLDVWLVTLHCQGLWMIASEKEMKLRELRRKKFRLWKDTLHMYRQLQDFWHPNVNRPTAFSLRQVAHKPIRYNFPFDLTVTTALVNTASLNPRDKVKAALYFTSVTKGEAFLLVRKVRVSAKSHCRMKHTKMYWLYAKKKTKEGAFLSRTSLESQFSEW